jgi:hypothetical protein
MKKKFSILFLLVTMSLMRMWGQTGATCADPLLFPLDSGCSANESTTSLEVWYAFTANSTDYDIYANNCGSPSTRLMERFYAYSGNCSALNLIAADSIVLSGDTVMRLQMNSLVIGDTYYLKLARSSSIIPCRTCLEALATYNFCIVPVGARPSITIIDPSGSEWQCPYGHGAVPPPILLQPKSIIS